MTRIAGGRSTFLGASFMECGGRAKRRHRFRLYRGAWSFQSRGNHAAPKRRRARVPSCRRTPYQMAPGRRKSKEMKCVGGGGGASFWACAKGGCDTGLGFRKGDYGLRPWFIARQGRHAGSAGLVWRHDGSLLRFRPKRQGPGAAGCGHHVRIHPREIILAAGAVPVCLCGGSAGTIAAAEQFLPANLCPLIKSTFGYQVSGKNPFLNWADLVIAETTCDGKKKMFELMGATKPMYVLELPQKADDADALARWTQEVRKFKEHLEQRFQTRITDEKLRAAIGLMNRERGLRRQLADLGIHLFFLRNHQLEHLLFF